MSQISILVPVLDNLAAFEDTLASILCHQPGNSELIVIHSGDYQDPYDLEYEGVKFLEGEPGEHWTQTMMQAAARLLDSQIVHTICPGVQVDEGWCDEAVQAFADARIAMASPVLVSESEPDFVVSIGVGRSASFRRKLVGENIKGAQLARLGHAVASEIVGPTSWCGFYRREILQAFWNSRWPLDCDVWDLDFGLCCQQLGLKNQILSDSYASLYIESDFDLTYHFSRGDIAQALMCKYKNPGVNRGRFIAACRDICDGFFSFRSIQHAFQRFAYRIADNPADISERWERLVELVDSLHCPNEIPARKAA